jgi:hypothetical protein
MCALAGDFCDLDIMGHGMKRTATAALVALTSCGTKGPEPRAAERVPDASTPIDVAEGDSSPLARGDGATGSTTLDDAGESPSPPSPTGTAGAPAGPPDASAALGGDSAAPSPGAKRGLAYGYDSDADLSALSKGIGWWYNWAASPDGTLSKGFTAGVEFVPMIWGGNFDTTTLAKQVPAGAKYLLTFNEPNFGSQSNLTPSQPLRSGRRSRLSPAPGG